MNDRLRIAVDAHRILCEPRTSGGTYLTSLLRQWAQWAPNVEVLLLAPRPSQPADAPVAGIASGRARWVTPESPVNPVERYRAQLAWQQVHIPRLLRRERPDVYFSPFHLTPLRPAGLPVVTTIHDLCFLGEPRWSSGSLIHRAQVWSACVRARRIICVSKFTQEALKRWSPRTAARAVVVANGVESATRAADAAAQVVVRAYPVLEPYRYLIWIGTPTARKNPGLLFATLAAHRRAHPESRLVVVAPAVSHPELRSMAGEEGVLGAVTLLGGVEEEIRDSLYRCARALVFPSCCEGFGYPILEAMRQGCPPVALEDSPARELAGGIVELPRVLKPEAFAAALARLTALSPAGREELAARLIARSQQFTARTMAEGTLAVLRDAAGK